MSYVTDQQIDSFRENVIGQCIAVNIAKEAKCVVAPLKIIRLGNHKEISRNGPNTAVKQLVIRISLTITDAEQSHSGTSRMLPAGGVLYAAS